MASNDLLASVAEKPRKTGQNSVLKYPKVFIIFKIEFG